MIRLLSRWKWKAGRRCATIILQLIKRRFHRLSPISCLNDDVLYEIFSYLDPKDAARAALVCVRWHHNATHAAYNSVFLHSTSPSSHVLSRTLLVHPHLRTHVQHVTVLHCTPDHIISLYKWLDHLPEGSLKSCRVISVFGKINSTFASPAWFNAEILELTEVGSHRPPANVAGTDWSALMNNTNTNWGILPPNGRDQCVEHIRPVTSLPFPTMIERMLATLRMDSDPRALRRTWTYRDTMRAGDKLTAETLYGIVRAQEAIMPSMSICKIRITLQSDEFFSNLLKQTMARGATLQEAHQIIFEHKDSTVKCACVWPRSPSWEVPPSAHTISARAYMRDGCTLPSATCTIDQLWAYTKKHGRVVYSVEVHFLYYTEEFANALEPSCNVCRISRLYLGYA
ncbi:hypothetical protein C2E23DRAFT_76260 [Lenzites betulinus]|nr:hypothetical protein C2E23DRAFT_76260 [Lenzites betulinus]